MPPSIEIQPAFDFPNIQDVLKLTSNIQMLQYQITRDFKWRWFTPISLTLAFIALVFITLVNIPLTGYETVTAFQNEFNTTEWHWFYRFIRFRIPTCDPYILNVGDSFTGNYSFFKWDIESIVKPTTGDSSVSYTGLPLTSCDILFIFIDGNLLSWNIDVVVLVACEESSFKVLMKTSFSVTQLPGRFTPLLGALRLYSDGTTDQTGAVLNDILQIAAMDLGNRVYNAYVGSNFTTPTIFSLQTNFDPCPLSLGNNAPCALAPPKPTIQNAAIVYTNATILQYDSTMPVDPILNPYVLDANTEGPMLNLIQAIHAAIRIDLGHSSTNNFILNPAALNNTIIPFFPETPYNTNTTALTSLLYNQWAHPSPDLEALLPFQVAGPAHIQAAYACRVQQRKSIGSLFISVLVATLSMFSSTWAIFMIIATNLAKRNDPLANRCDGHCSRHRMQVEPSYFDCQCRNDHSPSSPPESIEPELKAHVYEPIDST